MTRQQAIDAGIIRPRIGPVRFDSTTRMWADFDGPTIQSPVEAPTLRLRPGERERFEWEARHPQPATFDA